VGVDAGERVADGVAHVVHAALQAGEADGAEAVQDGRDVRERHPADLPVLPGGHVRAPVGAVRLDDARQVPRLLARRHAVGQLQPHHEPPVCSAMGMEVSLVVACSLVSNSVVTLLDQFVSRSQARSEPNPGRLVLSSVGPTNGWSKKERN
jgi:hypothetical protein